jgi:GxxExxY protein
MDKGKGILYKDECYKIVGACMEVHKTLGCGFLEAVYQEALAIEFQNCGIPFEREKEIEIRYKNTLLSKTYKADFLCYDQIILELKALNQITSDHAAQILNYLKASQLNLGLIANFGGQHFQYERYVS